MRDDVRLLREAIRLILEEENNEPRWGQPALGDPTLKRGSGGSSGGAQIYKDYKPSWWEKLKSGLTGKKSAAMQGKEREDAERQSAQERADQIKWGMRYVTPPTVTDLPPDSWRDPDFSQKFAGIFPRELLNGFNPYKSPQFMDLALIDAMWENQTIKKFNDVIKNFVSQTGSQFSMPYTSHDPQKLLQDRGQHLKWLGDWANDFIEEVEKEKLRAPGKRRAAEKAQKRAAQEERERANRERKGQPRTQQQQEPHREEG